MAQKKKYKLKLWPKILLVVIVLGSIGFYYGYEYYQEYLYKQSNECKIMELGYTKENAQLMEEKLSEEELMEIMNYEYNEFIPEFLKCEFFIFKNLDLYLSQVITQEDDFFKYHGTDGYDYDYIVALTNVGALDPFYTNTKTTNRDDNYQMLVNKYYELGKDYKPDDLVSVSWDYRLGLEKDYKYVRKEAYDAYLEMWHAANKEGIYLLIDSAYRSSEEQEEVFNYYANLKGNTYADSIAARPGFSEHQTGLALDIYAKECANANIFKDSKAYAWLSTNSYKYGYILRYPEGKEELTGYNYESWHYRYVGKEIALKVYESGLTYDEYYIYYIDKQL